MSELDKTFVLESYKGIQRKGDAYAVTINRAIPDAAELVLGQIKY